MNSAHRTSALERLDLHLRVTFEVIYRERNRTRGAERLFVSQPSVSHALARCARGELRREGRTDGTGA